MHSTRLLASIFVCLLSGGVVIGQIGQTVARGDVKAGIATAQVADMDVEPVKGTPFCATVSTEHTQAFADGNRIHTSDSSSVCRDSEGRTRREASLNLLGATAQTSLPKLITIVDPVAGFRYMLDSESKTAHRMPLESAAYIPSKIAAAGTPERGAQFFFQHFDIGGPNMVAGGDVAFQKTSPSSDDPAPTIDSLGDQTIDGIHAIGTRITTTIPAGKIGNDQPILVTSERWYSPELKAAIMSKHIDPWAGELKTTFTTVSTSMPDSSLFQVPSYYKIVDEKALMLEKPMLMPHVP